MYKFVYSVDVFDFKDSGLTSLLSLNFCFILNYFDSFDVLFYSGCCDARRILKFACNFPM